MGAQGAGESCHRMIGGRFLSKRLQHGENPAIIESVFPLRIWQPHRLKEITHARQKSIHRHSRPRPEAQAAPADAPQLHHRRAGRRADCPRRQPRALLYAQPLHRRIFAPLLCASGCDRFPRRRGVLRRRIHPLRRRNGTVLWSYPGRVGRVVQRVGQVPDCVVGHAAVHRQRKRPPDVQRADDQRNSVCADWQHPRGDCFWGTKSTPK